MELEALVIGVPIAIIAMVVGGIAIGAVWTATDQIVGTSDNQQLQQTYENGKTIINSAETAQDWIAVLGIIAMIIGGVLWIAKSVF